MISPILKYGDQIITEDTTITHIGIETLTCELNNAGAPRAESLDMYTTYETIFQVLLNATIHAHGTIGLKRF